MEASYLAEGSLNTTARSYWQALRTRAHVSTDIDNTIALTDMSKEAENDWGAYTAGQVLTDKTLYNIRRERRCEYMAEGLRYMASRELGSRRVITSTLALSTAAASFRWFLRNTGPIPQPYICTAHPARLAAQILSR